eukprot:TRINITY_DN2161_c0_g2_i6.p1 TRINITY_DN2161_c0_g2~~TRINITY_DN2161_c0_g2_i6.p1  ORF type:complete len:704 (+),score=111.14 TRINITY_DN2161_c0_g2_i6:328-2439(+)
MVRSLKLSYCEREIIRNFDEISQRVGTNKIEDTGQFGISTIQGRPVAFGMSQIIQLIDVERFAALKKSLVPILPDYRNEVGNVKILINHSIGGSFVLSSQVFPYVNSAPIPLVINAEIFMQSEQKPKAIEAFANIVFDDVTSLGEANDYHILKYVLLDGKPAARKWTIDEIRGNKNAFVRAVASTVETRSTIYLKAFFKTKRVNHVALVLELQNREFLFGGRRKEQARPQDLDFEYIETRKVYNLFYSDPQERERVPYVAEPLASLLKCVFTSDEAAFKYASYFYRPTELYTAAPAFRTFMNREIQILGGHWRSQSIIGCAWEFFYIANLVENDGMKKKLMNNVIEILTCEYAQLAELRRLCNTFINLLLQYKSTNMTFYKIACSMTYKLIQRLTTDFFGRGGDSDILNFRACVIRILDSMIDQSREFQSTKNSLTQARALYRTFKSISISNEQIIGMLCRNFDDYVAQTLQLNRRREDNEKAKVKGKEPAAQTKPLDIEEIGTLSDLQEVKKPQMVLHVSTEASNYTAATKMNGTPQEIEEGIIFSYLIDTEVYDTIQLLMRNVVFSPLVANPFSSCLLKLDTLSIKRDLSKIVLKDLKEQIWNDTTILSPFEINGQRVENMFQLLTPRMRQFSLQPVYGLSCVLNVSSAFENANFFTYMMSHNWRNHLDKGIPNSYSISDLLTVTGTSLIQHISCIQKPVM